MAKSKLTADIPGIGKIEVSGNHATEDSIQDLIAVMSSQTRIKNRDIKDFNDNIEEAADNVDEFSDSVEKAEKAQSSAAKKMSTFANKTSDGVQGLQKFADAGGSLSSVVEGVGEVIVGMARGLGGVIPFVGEGLEEITGALGMAAVGLTGMAVGMTESFIGINKQLFNSGLQMAGGFDSFSKLATEASLPVTEFTNAMLLSSDRLRLFSSGAPGGIQQVSKALKELHDDGIMENLYSLGFTTEEVVAGMADYAIAAQRQGRNLSSAELATGTEQYLKNLRELSRLTGVSVKEAQAQVEADRANLFVQRQLMQVSEGQRAEAAAFAANLEAMGYGPMRDFIIAGQSMSRESAIMSSQMPIAAGIMQNAYAQIANGTLTNEQATEYLRNQLRARSGEVGSELANVVNTFGQTPQLASDFGTLGTAVRTTQELLGAANSKLGETANNIEPGSIQENLGKFESTLNNVQSEIQNVFLETLKGASPPIGKFIDNIDAAADKLGELVNAIASGSLSDMQNKATATAQKELESLGRELVLEAGGAAGGMSLSARNQSNLEERFLADPDSLSLEERQDLIQTLQRQYREDSNVFVRWLGDLSSTTSDLFGNLDARIESDDRLRQRILDTRAEMASRSATAEFATGGIARGPKSGYAAELHGTEAVVPLPNGESIPVSLTTSGMRGLIEGIVDTTISNSSSKDADTEIVADISASLDGSKTLGELLQVNKSMLQYFITSMQKTEEMLRVMDESNYIARSGQYARA